MQIDDNDAPNYNTVDRKIELHDFDSGTYQEWQLAHVIDGYYTIRSVKSGMYLSVKSGEINSDSVALVQQSSGTSDRQQWRIFPSASGAYILRPKSGKNYSSDWCMSAGIGVGATGRNVEQRAYTHDTDYKDEWILIFRDTYVCLTYDVKVVYGAECDLTEEEINTLFENATLAFIPQFNIAFELDSISASSLMDLDTNCSVQGINGICTDNCGIWQYCNRTHHRSASLRLDDLYFSDDFLWVGIVGYDMCWVDDDESTSSHLSVDGLAHRPGQEAVITTNNSHGNVVCLQHELTHNIGATHCSNSTGNCIFKDNLNRWCSACVNAIIDNCY